MKKFTALCLLILTAGIASAENMYTVTGTSTSAAAYGDAAITFQVTTAIEVTELSFFGESMGGGDTPWVQLWNVDTVDNLASVSWDAGAATAGWNDKALPTAVTLTPGVTYQLQSHAYWIPRYTNSSAFTFASEITGTSFQHDRTWYNWAPLNAPASSATTITENLPAMMNLSYSVIPEPSSILMTLMGFSIIGFSLRRRK
ncbi:DUF4082 domain-containing protein [Kiritimatiellota bacterium B12222]|nr:DUF4082 domain-containing protein [Kiritimatiellota bacterium B12222]